MKAIVDHVDGDVVSLEEIGSKKLVKVRRSELPKVIGEGSVLEKTGSGWVLDKEETAKRRAKAAGLVNDLFA